MIGKHIGIRKSFYKTTWRLKEWSSNKWTT